MEAEASAKVKSHHDEAFRWVRITTHQSSRFNQPLIFIAHSIWKYKLISWHVTGRNWSLSKTAFIFIWIYVYLGNRLLIREALWIYTIFHNYILFNRWLFLIISYINEALKFDEQGKTRKALELYHKGEKCSWNWLRFGDLNSTFTLKVASPTEGTKLLVQSLCETGPTSLFWTPISVLRFEDAQ